MEFWFWSHFMAKLFMSFFCWWTYPVNMGLSTTYNLLVSQLSINESESIISWIRLSCFFYSFSLPWAMYYIRHIAVEIRRCILRSIKLNASVDVMMLEYFFIKFCYVSKFKSFKLLEHTGATIYYCIYYWLDVTVLTYFVRSSRLEYDVDFLGRYLKTM